MHFKCVNCYKQFNCGKKLLDHIHLVHGNTNLLYECPAHFCSKKYNRYASAKSHYIRNHENSNCSISIVDRQFVFCKVCQLQVVGSKHKVISHIGEHIAKFTSVTCPVIDCKAVYNNKKSFFSHIFRNHRDWNLTNLNSDYDCPRVPTTATTSGQIQTFSHEDNCGLEKLKLPNDEDVKSEIDIMDYLFRLLIKLEIKNSISNIAITEICQEIKELLKLNSQMREDLLKDILVSKGISTDKANEIVTIFQCTETPIENSFKTGGPLSTSHRRQSYFLKHGSKYLVHPQVLYGGQNETEEKKHKFLYIPILDVLKKLLNNRDFLESVLETKKSEEGILKSFRDGQHFIERDFLNDPLTLKLNLYMDELEVANPLGAYKSIHKISCFYWQVMNLNNIHKSMLQSIQPCIFANYNTISTYGFDKIVKPLVEDISRLETEGIFVESISKTFKGTVAVICGDNLSSNSLGGFSTGFGHDNGICCRQCMVKKKDIKLNDVVPDERTVERHNFHVSQLELNGAVDSCRLYGVKASTLLNDLKHYHVIDGMPPDVMHDLLEGIVPYEIALVLKKLIDDKETDISFKSLNDKISNFQYKYLDKQSKLHSLHKKFHLKHSVGGNASIHWTLIRLLPIMIGSLVDESDQSWQLLLLLKDIVEISLAPVISIDMIAYLRMQISTHKHLFLEVFPNRRLKMKHHFVEHYPTMMIKFGPLVHLWCMRFEAKHSSSKQSIVKSKNFKNPLKFLAEKHRKMLYYNLSSPDFFGQKDLVVSNSVLMHESDIDCGNLQRLKEVQNSPFYERCLNVSNLGVKYEEGLVVLLPTRMQPLGFGVIMSIWIIEKKLFFECHLCESNFNAHLRCYEIEENLKKSLFSIEDLKDPLPLPFYIVNGKKCIILKYGIPNLM